MNGPLQRILSSQIFFLVLLIVILGGIATFFNPAFFSSRNLMNILNQNAVIGVVAAGATFVMVSGNFDISVGSMVGLTTTLAASMVVRGYSLPLAMVTGFAVCVLCGFTNGLVIAKTRTPSFIMTLATLSVFYGISLIITGGITQSLGGKFFTLGRGLAFGAVPNPILVLGAVYGFVYFMFRYTRFGRRIYAVGGNEEAAFLSGVNTDLIKILIYTLNGVLVGVGALVLLSRLGSALPSTGSGMELRAIAAVVIGGVPLSGGKGSAIGTFLGVILMGLISNVLNLLNISAYYQEVAIGLIIAVAVIVSNLGKIRRR